MTVSGGAIQGDFDSFVVEGRYSEIAGSGELSVQATEIFEVFL
jgi:hypothetical protein